ncbi:FAD-binding domain-containing protein [Nitrogeniibacter aestuarii]|uniref:FAD-binding domain-containing protein n=1 Tax=Nitrogeniibacter aestuarii TaxID=2815343 RepID=UPI001E29514C|nr:deoxyribodipyrimidine photo-lyase [Nitrogeniibacter aestuarii]
MDGIQIVWFKRDLRTHDHMPLVEAARAGSVLPLYIVEPGLWQQPESSLRQWRFIGQSLRELDQSLKALGAPGLIVRHGEAVEVLEQVRQQFGKAALWSHEETGNMWTFCRDAAISRWCRCNNVTWQEYRQDGVVRRLGNRDGWAAHRDRFMALDLAPQPARIRGVSILSDPLPVRPVSTLADDDCPGAQPGGRTAGLMLLDSFLQQRGVDYARGMSSPLSAADACSRLSPHIAYGTLSMREVVQALRQRRREVKADPALSAWRRPLAAFEARLAWQSHFMQKLESEPEMEWRNLHPAMADERQSVDPERFAAWAEGRTGWPFVDACMRMLHHTGWINFRMRAMLAAVACYHLWQPWREAGLHLARQFIDYEPGIHWSQMQMQSGSTGINAFRIYNPIKQSHDQDPEGTFIRRWVPELAQVPDAWIHEPWRMDASLQARSGCRIGRDYPAPIVDHEAAARKARARLRAAYRGEDALEASQAVMARHGSRKRRADGGRTGSARRNDGQMGLFG